MFIFLAAQLEGKVCTLILLWNGGRNGTQKEKMVIDVNENVFEGEKSKRVFHKVVLIDIG
jgi:hypothetical protein